MDEMTPELRSAYSRWLATQRPRASFICARDGCGKVFESYAVVPGKANSGRYCSTLCRVKAHQRRKRAKARPNPAPDDHSAT